jgi:hypothetical protein
MIVLPDLLRQAYEKTLFKTYLQSIIAITQFGKPLSIFELLVAIPQHGLPTLYSIDENIDYGKYLWKVHW